MDRTQYFDILFEQVRCKRAVPYLKQEIEDHIDDQKVAFKAQGMNEFDAEMAAVKEMGDPVETGMQLDIVHRPKMEWKLVIGIAVMGLIGLWIQFLITKGYCPNENLFWYVSVMSRQLMGILIGIVILVAAYFCDYSLLIKWSFPCWVLLELAIIYLCLAGRTMNGRSYRAMHLAYFLIPFLAGLVYKYKGEQWRGLLKSIGCVAISFFTILNIPDLASSLTIAISGIFMISIAVYKKWYNINVKKALIGIWGPIAAGCVSLGGIVWWKITRGELTYHIVKIRAWLNGESGNYILNHAVKDGIQQDDNLFEYIRNDYVWAYLFENLELWQGILLIFAMFVCMGSILRIVMKQKNRLGYLVGLGCIIYLILHAVLYIGMNFQMIPFAASYMPFVSHGMAPMVVTYFYMGILLSVFRNTNVVRN